MKGDHPQSKNFMENIRSNNSAVEFASMRAQIAPPPGHGPYCFRIHGQIYHLTGPMHPREGKRPEYSQLYILDAEEALNARIGQRANSGCFPPLMNELGILMQQINPFAQAYKMMREFEIEEENLAQAYLVQKWWKMPFYRMLSSATTRSHLSSYWHFMC
jgi:hypothetical protein